MEADIKKIRSQNQKLREEISAMAARVTVDWPESKEFGPREQYAFRVGNSGFVETWKGVHQILCALCEVTGGDMTVANVVMEKGAVIDPHKHTRVETIHVVEGDFEEPVSGRIMIEGDSMRIPAGDVHGGKTLGGCLLTVTWRPAFESIDPEERIEAAAERAAAQCGEES